MPMFVPKIFDQTDFIQIRQFLATYPLATLIAPTNEGVEACHIPLIWQDDGSEWGCLYGHVAKVNPIYQQALPSKNWLAVFSDGGHYISPNWYPSKAQTHKEVPTWNYRSVHISGQIELLTTPHELKTILTLLTSTFEQNQPKPWSLADAPDKYIDAMCRAIVGLRLSINKIDGQFKLSQNKTLDNKKGVISGLSQLNTASAAQMAKLVNDSM